MDQILAGSRQHPAAQSVRLPTKIFAITGENQNVLGQGIQRNHAVDFLRGLVMVFMTLDHTRDFFSHAGFSPTDLDKTDLGWFFTRWITHFCAPVFVLLAGFSAYLTSTRKLGVWPWSRFLITRGFWLMFLEITWVRLSWVGNFNYHNTFLQVIWAIGVAMTALGITILLFSKIFKGGVLGRPEIVGTIGLFIVALHNLLDHIHSYHLAGAAPLWMMLHEVGSFEVFSGYSVTIYYPVLAWIGVLFLGFYLGYWWTTYRGSRSKVLTSVGLFCVILFCITRGMNFYGDPTHWTFGMTWQKTLMSFLNTTKYPPSFEYLLMTLGPSLLFLGWLESSKITETSRIAELGKVPLFFYLAHLPLIHLSSKLYGMAVLGPKEIIENHATPHLYGVGLGGVYLATCAMLLVLFPLCRRFFKVKSRSTSVWLRYL